jgi:hypothetical protein
MAWITITTNDVKTRLAGAELTAYQTAALAVGQTDPLPEIIQGVIREVRGRVAACRQNTLGDGDTIPDELLHHALAVIRYRLTTRLPIAVKEERKQEYDDALETLREVAKCEFVVESPTTPTSEVVGTVEPTITANTRMFTRTTQAGA